MFDSINILTTIAVSLFVGLAVGSALYAVMVFSDEGQARIDRRVDKYLVRKARRAPSLAATRDQQRAALFAELDRRWQGRSLFKSLQTSIEAAGLGITSTELLLIQIGIGLLLSIPLWISFHLVGLLLTPVMIVVSGFIVRWVVSYKAKRRVSKFEDQLADNLAVLAGSVRGGFSLFQALQLVAKEAAEPSKVEFTKVVQEVSLGNPMATALEGLATRIPTEDVDILVTAIAMQQQTGGNLTHVLDVVAATVRERHRVKRDIKSLTAQQRFSAVLLCALPFLLAGTLFIISPRYIGHLFQPTWVLCMPVGAFILSVIGFIVMRKMADIDV